MPNLFRHIEFGVLVDLDTDVTSSPIEGIDMGYEKYVTIIWVGKG